MRIKSIRVRFDSDERVELNRDDLARSEDSSLKELARADQPGASPKADDDGWVTSEEIRATQGLNARSHFAYQNMREQALRLRHAGRSIVDLRAAQDTGTLVVPSAPPVLEAPVGGLAELPRSAYEPLADYLAARFVPAESYEAQYGDPGDRVYHFGGDDVVARYSLHEIKAALAILTAREGGVEFGLAKDQGGRHHFVHGQADKVELDSAVTGFDLLFHTHPKEGSRAAFPSRGDLYMARAFDPDHCAGAVTVDGWFTEYQSSEAAQTRSEPARLWKEARFPLAE